MNYGEIPNNGIDDDNNGYVDDTFGWDFCSDDNNPIDVDKHGTHVSGTIAARVGNGLGILNGDSLFMLKEEHGLASNMIKEVYIQNWNLIFQFKRLTKDESFTVDSIVLVAVSTRFVCG